MYFAFVFSFRICSNKLYIGVIKITSQLHSQEYFSHAHTVRLKIYSLGAALCGDAFSILERDCSVCSFDLVNEVTFMLSEVARENTQMIMIIII